MRVLNFLSKPINEADCCYLRYRIDDSDEGNDSPYKNREWVTNLCKSSRPAHVSLDVSCTKPHNSRKLATRDAKNECMDAEAEYQH